MKIELLLFSRHSRLILPSFFSFFLLLDYKITSVRTAVKGHEKKNRTARYYNQSETIVSDDLLFSFEDIKKKKRNYYYKEFENEHRWLFKVKVEYIKIISITSSYKFDHLTIFNWKIIYLSIIKEIISF